MYLTQSKEVEDRFFVKAIKGANINEADWREAAAEEKQKIENKQEDYE